MTDNNDRKYIRKEALAVLDYISRKCPNTNSINTALSLKNICPVIFANYEWQKVGRPILTDRTKAILEEVEETMKRCEDCGWKQGSTCKPGADAYCLLVGIRRAYEKGTKHEG